MNGDNSLSRPTPSQTTARGARWAGCAWTAAAAVGACMLALAPGAYAARPGDKPVIELEVGGSQLVRPTSPPERVVVGEPNVCDVSSVSGGALFLTAKQPGETQMTITGRDGSLSIYRIVSSVPTVALTQALRQAFPQEEDLQARSVGGAVYLAGTVSDAVVVEAASRLAQSLYAGAGRKVGEIVNLLQVATPQQVQVHLRFVEISRTNMRAMGFNGWYNDNNSAAGLFGPQQPSHYPISDDKQRFVGPANPAVPTGGTAAPGQPNANPFLPLLTAPVSGAFSIALASTDWFGALPMSFTLGLLEGRGVAKTLSEPTLVAVSGKQAKFLVGGEFPIPIPSTLGQVSIQFKSYGAQLAFTPTVLAQDTVSLEVESLVSDIDRANQVVISSTTVPALSSRQSNTTVRLRDGQSFAIAGLLSDKLTNTQQRVPGLGDIPLLGIFFRQISTQRQETELMVMVTVNLVKPLEAQQVPPGLNQDEFTEPGNLELFVMGTLDKATSGEKSSHPAAPVRRGPARAMNQPDGLVGFSR